MPVNIVYRHALMLTALLCLFALSACFGSSASTTPSSDEDYRIEVVAPGFDHAWGMAFLPASSTASMALVTERVGRLNLVDLTTGETHSLAGIPEVSAIGQGGLLDVAIHPDFASGENWVYLTYAAPHPEQLGHYATHLGRGRLDISALQLTDFERLHIFTPFHSSRIHFGSRMVFDKQGRLYVTSGDRGQRHSAQDLSSYWGKTLRFEADGSIPADNPFVNDPDALDAIYTYGHRNAQGMAIEPGTNLLWQHEHGQQDGDEINIIDQPGGNYGWPLATYAREYSSGLPIGVLPPAHPDTINPVYYWDGTRYDDGQRGFPPSGMAFYHGEAFTAWQGNLLMGNLAHQYLGRFELEGRNVVREHRLLAGRNWRIRDVNVHPDTGLVYVLIDKPNAPLIRLLPLK